MSRDGWLVVGAGPAGLLAARALRDVGVPFRVVERHHDVGGIWDMANPGSPMYRSAHFISSRTTSGFPGFPMPECFPDYPSNTQILSYIRAFADAEGLRDHIDFGVEVGHAEPKADGWHVRFADGAEGRHAGLIACNGVTWTPNRPALPGEYDFAGEVIHSRDYREPGSLNGRRVLIVGLGNSGADIACDAARYADAAFLSVRRGYHLIPKHVAGLPADLWFAGADPGQIRPALDAIVGDVTRFGLPAPDHPLFASHPLLNTEILHHLGHGRIAARGDLVRLDREEAVFADGRRERVDLVILATGYRHDLPFLPSELLDWRGNRPNLHLNMFARGLPRFAAIGFVEIASAAYGLFDRMARIVAAAARDQAGDPDRAARLRAIVESGDAPDVRGGKQFLASDRHANYVDAAAFHRALDWLEVEMGWTPGRVAA